MALSTLLVKKSSKATRRTGFSKSLGSNGFSVVLMRIRDGGAKGSRCTLSTKKVKVPKSWWPVRSRYAPYPLRSMRSKVVLRRCIPIPGGRRLVDGWRLRNHIRPAFSGRLLRTAVAERDRTRQNADEDARQPWRPGVI